MQVRPNPEGPTSRRLSQIDGLLAGFNVLASDCRLVRQKQQWDRLEKLREEMRRQWEGLTREVPLAMDDLEGFCDTAIFAYRNALAGLVAADLPKVVGLCSLSYAVSRIVEPSSANFLDDVHVCLQSLERQEDRRMLEASMAKLWPATEQVDQDSHIGGEIAPRQPQDWTYHPSSYPPAYPSATSSQPWQIQDVPSLPYSSTAFEALSGGLPVATNWVHTSQGRPFEPLGTATDTHDYSVLSWIPGGTLNAISDTSWPDPDQTGFQVGSFGRLERTSQPKAASSAPNGPHHLQDTELFKAIGTFLDGSSDFLYLLSGRGKTAKNLGSCLSSSQERLKDKEKLQSSYVEPLLKREELLQAPCSTILSIAKKFVAYGCLQSVEEVQSYMVTVAEELFHDKAAHGFFLDSIKTLPTEAELSTQECRCLASAKLGAVRCPYCRKSFSKKSNMVRDELCATCRGRVSDVQGKGS